jgi:hypothetical protein
MPRTGKPSKINLCNSDMHYSVNARRMGQAVVAAHWAQNKRG